MAGACAWVACTSQGWVVRVDYFDWQALMVELPMPVQLLRAMELKELLRATCKKVLVLEDRLEFP